jgi:hypothetical protein
LLDFGFTTYLGFEKKISFSLVILDLAQEEKHRKTFN